MLDFVLKPGTLTETVEVSAAAALLDSETSTVGQVISNTIVEMPLNGRNYLTLATLTAGTTPNPGGRTSLKAASTPERPTCRSTELMCAMGASRQNVRLPGANYLQAGSVTRHTEPTSARVYAGGQRHSQAGKRGSDDFRVNCGHQQSCHLLFPSALTAFHYAQRSENNSGCGHSQSGGQDQGHLVSP